MSFWNGAFWGPMLILWGVYSIKHLEIQYIKICQQHIRAKMCNIMLIPPRLCLYTALWSSVFRGLCRTIQDNIHSLILFAFHELHLMHTSINYTILFSKNTMASDGQCFCGPEKTTWDSTQSCWILSSLLAFSTLQGSTSANDFAVL